MLGCEAPLTPDDEEARSWVLAELSRPDYAPEEPSHLSRFFNWLLERFFSGAVKSAPASFPVAGFFIFLLGIALLAIIVIVATHPIRLRRRMRHTAVFDADSELSLTDVRKKISEARAQGDLDAVLVWSYRLFVLNLARGGILRDTPGLTANEAAQAAITALPALTDAINQATYSFAAVRYGDAHATAADCEQIDSLISAYAHAPKPKVDA